MLVLSFTTLIEEAIADPNVKKASGNVRSFDDLLRPENLEQLERHHEGLFAFLAFHPEADSTVAEYVRSGTLASDSGPRLLVLFTLDSAARFPVRLGSNAFQSWLDLDAEVHPAYQMVRMMFLPGRIPPLPGILFFGSFAVPDCIYVSLADVTELEPLRQRLREVFSLADHSLRKGGSGGREGWSDALGTQLQKDGIDYVRSTSISPREWLLRGYQFVRDHRGDLVSMLGLLS
jgi:hypothetical protein